MLILDEEAVRAHLRFEDLIPEMERALRALSAGEAVQPMRVMLPVEGRGFLGSMPACAGGHLGAKLVTLFPGNLGQPTHHALVALFDTQTGEPLAIMDGRLITEMRTAAVSAVATRLLARADASVLAVIGAGVQAGSHVEALRLVRPIREVRVWSPRRAAEFARRHGAQAARSAEEAVRGADVVVVATSARNPVLAGKWLSPGAHVNAVGAPRPDWRELDDAVLLQSKLYVESRQAAGTESGDVIAAGEVFAEIGEVIAGSRPARESADEITLFKSVGVAVEDVASAALVYRKSRA
jgi:ornithine cyclodeaminase/alanine dehydrogenase-like protein (mu-crystallin family)